MRELDPTPGAPRTTRNRCASWRLLVVAGTPSGRREQQLLCLYLTARFWWSRGLSRWRNNKEGFPVSMPMLRLVVRVTIEFDTPFLVADGEMTELSDAVPVVDANDLPVIPGSSLAGVLRHAFEEDRGDERRGHP